MHTRDYNHPNTIRIFNSHHHIVDGSKSYVNNIHGKCDIKQLQASINAFNDSSSKVRVLLTSTKACIKGINLIGASRVVLIDIVWNSTEGFQTTYSKTILSLPTKLNPTAQTSIKFTILSPCLIDR